MSDAADTKVASYFERPGHRDAVVRGIISGALSLKYAYAGSAAHTHDRLAHQDGYESVKGPEAAVRSALRGAGIDDVPALVEIGPGNGESSLKLLDELRDARQPPTTFLALDFSQTLLEIAKRNFERERPDLMFADQLWDVEDGPTAKIDQWRHGDAPLVVLFLGNTIGNFERPGAALRDIQRSMRVGDVLVVGATLRNAFTSESAILAAYAGPIFRDAAIEPLVACGISSEDIEFTLSYEKHEVVGHAVFRRPVFMADQELPEDHSVRCFVSRRYLPGEINALVSAAGLRPVPHAAEQSAQHLVVVAVKEAPDGTTGSKPAPVAERR